MTHPNDGGPAFPVPDSDDYHAAPGMSLRDYFAAKALASLLVDSELDGPPHEFARAAYDYADAMLDAREVPKA